MMSSQASLPLYQENSGLCELQAPLPLPPAAGLPRVVNTSHPEEPVFCEDVHLAQTLPPYVTTFPGLEKVSQPPKVTSSSGSSLAFTAPFPVLSQAGLQAVRQIISR